MTAAVKTPKTDPVVAAVVAENAKYRASLADKVKALREGGEFKAFDWEWLSRRGNYYTIITPEVAAELLDRNTGNRPFKRRAIAQYARDMAAGDWNPDASTIEMNRNGELMNGQNRCMASVESGSPFPTLFRTGLDPDAKNHIDQGVKRTVSDAFRMEGLVDPNSVASALAARERYERTVREYGGRQTMNPRRVPMTHAEALEYLEAHPSLGQFVTLATAMHREGPGVPRTVFLAALSLFSESSEKMAREFAERFINGESTGTGDPLLALSRYCARAKSPSELKTRSRNRNQQHLAAVVRVWNAWLQNEKLDRLQVKDSDLFEQPV